MNNLKKIRIQKKLTQSEVSNAIGISYQSLGLYENEKNKPEPETLCKLADYFGVTVDYLLGREPESGLIYIHKNPALTAAEEELLMTYHNIAPELQGTALNVLKTFAGNMLEETPDKIKKW